MPYESHARSLCRRLHFELSPLPSLFYFLAIFASDRFWRIVQLSEKQLPANPAVGRLKHMVEEVKLTVPVVADLRSGTLVDRHWEVLDNVLGMDIREQGAVTFKQMMEVTRSGKAMIQGSGVNQFYNVHTHPPVFQAVVYHWHRPNLLLSILRSEGFLLRQRAITMPFVVQRKVPAAPGPPCKRDSLFMPSASGSLEPGKPQGRVGPSELRCDQRRSRIRSCPATPKGDLLSVYSAMLGTQLFAMELLPIATKLHCTRINP